MKKKILNIGLIIIFCTMLIGLTGCGEEGIVKQSVIDSKSDVPQRAQQAANKEKIASAKDYAKALIQDEVQTYYAQKYVNGNESNLKLRDYILEQFKDGENLNNNGYLTVENEKIVIYSDSTMNELLAEGTIDDYGKITWDD